MIKKELEYKEGKVLLTKDGNKTKVELNPTCEHI